ncbi:MAG: hypothetical protein ACLFWD_01645 [Anaerolineales bacterium]
MLERGKHKEAARLFLDLAQRAEDLHVSQAPLLYLQSGRAFALANQPDPSLKQIKRAFSLLAEGGDQRRLTYAGKRTITELEQLGYQENAKQLREVWRALLGDHPNDEEAPPSHRQLPAKCEQCGANLHPDELDPISEGSAVCAYCGTHIPIRTE